MTYQVTLLMSEFVTHDVKHYFIERPNGFSVTPGQGVELAIDRPEWRDKRRPFTPTNLANDKILEFTIKSYSDHNGVTQELAKLEPGTKLLLSEPFGTISYQGPGVFLAGGAGITPFLAILRERAYKNELENQTLMFSNKTPEDIICEKELRHYLGDRCLFFCTEGEGPGYLHRRIDKEFLSQTINNFDQQFYICGPPGFLKAVNTALTELGANTNALIFEKK